MSLVIDLEPLGLVRVYKNTIQREIPDHKCINTNAAFILYNDQSGQVFVWIGKNAIKQDSCLAIEIGKSLRREMSFEDLGSIEIIFEGAEERNPMYVEFLRLLKTTVDIHASPEYEVLKYQDITNAKKTLGQVCFENDIWLHKVLWVESPDSSGTIAQFQMASIYSDKAIITIEANNQWDVWIGDKISDDEFDSAMSLLNKMHLYKVDTSNHEGLRKDPFFVIDPCTSCNDGHDFGCIRCVNQFYERSIFRAQVLHDNRLGSRLQTHELEDDFLNLHSDSICSLDSNITRIAAFPMTSMWHIVDWSFDSFLKSVGFSSDSISLFSSPASPKDVHNVLSSDRFLVKPPVAKDNEIESLRKQLLTTPSELVGWQVYIKEFGVAVVTDLGRNEIELGRGKYFYLIQTAESDSQAAKQMVIDTQKCVKYLSVSDSDELDTHQASNVSSNDAASGVAWMSPEVTSDEDPTVVAARSLSEALSAAISAVKLASAAAAATASASASTSIQTHGHASTTTPSASSTSSQTNADALISPLESIEPDFQGESVNNNTTNEERRREPSPLAMGVSGLYEVYSVQPLNKLY